MKKLSLFIALFALTCCSCEELPNTRARSLNDEARCVFEHATGKKVQVIGWAGPDHDGVTFVFDDGSWLMLSNPGGRLIMSHLEPVKEPE